MKLPKNFLIALPKIHSTVMVYGITKNPFKAVVVSIEPPRLMRVKRLLDGEEFEGVDYAMVTHAKI